MLAMPDLNEMITITQAIEITGTQYTRSRISQVARAGGFPGAIQVGRVWLIPKVEFTNWLETERRPGPKTEK